MTSPTIDRRNSLDAYQPAEIASVVKEVGVAKAALGVQPLLIRAVLAGAFIAFGCLFYIVTISGAAPLTGTAGSRSRGRAGRTAGSGGSVPRMATASPAS